MTVSAIETEKEIVTETEAVKETETVKETEKVTGTFLGLGSRDSDCHRDRFSALTETFFCQKDNYKIL